MITQVAKAIKALYDGAGGAALRTVNTGGQWLQQAPEGTTEPYIVIFITGSTTDDMMGAATNRLETVDVQFNIYSKADDGGVESADILDKLIALYDWSTLTYTSYTHISVRRTGTANVGFVDEVWQMVALYEITYQE